jgi:hypothetical protein
MILAPAIGMADLACWYRCLTVLLQLRPIALHHQLAKCCAACCLCPAVVLPWSCRGLAVVLPVPGVHPEEGCLELLAGRG